MLRLLFLVWCAIGFWVVLFTPLVRKARFAQPNYPSWWKKFLPVYIVSVISVLVVASLMSRTPSDIIIAFWYGSFILTVTTCALALGGGLVMVAYRGIRLARDGDSEQLSDMGVRVLHIVGIVLAIAAINALF